MPDPDNNSPELIDDLSRNPTKEENQKLINIITKLYCHGISQEFRRPVHIMYPEIAFNYLKAIHEPMDLGSLLFLLHKETGSLISIRNKLRLIFSNAISFNTDAHQMISISSHINSFAKSLWVELMNIPYIPEPIASNVTFSTERYLSRFNRFRFVSSYNMSIFEVKELNSKLKELVEMNQFDKYENDDFISNFTKRLKETLKIFQNTIDSFEPLESNENDNKATATTTTKESNHFITKLSLNDAFHLISESLDFKSLKFSSDNTQSYILPSFISSKYNNFYVRKKSINPNAIEVLNLVDDIIGELLPTVVERLTRGIDI